MAMKMMVPQEETPHPQRRWCGMVKTPLSDAPVLELEREPGRGEGKEKTSASIDPPVPIERQIVVV